jgi:hypothetical protein
MILSSKPVNLVARSIAAVATMVPGRIVFLKSKMIGQFRLQRSLQDCFGELFQEAVLADDAFRLLVIGQHLVYQCLVDWHRFSFSSSDGRLHSSFYTLPVRIRLTHPLPKSMLQHCFGRVATPLGTGRRRAIFRRCFVRRINSSSRYGR